MKKTLITFVFGIIALSPVSAFALDGFPDFPMSLWGSVTINGSAAPAGSVVRAYYGNALAATATTTETGIYGYTEPTKQKLVIGSGSGAITFTIQTIAPCTYGGTDTSTSIETYPAFVSGLTVRKDLAFTRQVIGGGGCGGGEGGSGVGDGTIPPVATSTNSNGSLLATFSGFVTYSLGMNSTTTVDVSAGTVVSGPSNWNGKLTLPHATSSFVLSASSGHTASAVEVIEIGAGDTPLVLDKAAKLTFSGQTGKLIGWSQAGVFHQITAICDSASSPALANGADCKLDVGSDLVVWTKHFTTFIAYSETAIPQPASGSSGSSGGGGGGGSAYIPPAATPATSTVATSSVKTATSTSPSASPATTSAPVLVPSPNAGVVLGASTFHFARTLRYGSENSDVTELQRVLAQLGYLSTSSSGYFGWRTEEAVEKFQKDHGIAVTGIVGPQTRDALNKLTATTTQPTATSTEEKIAQLKEILKTLQAQLTKLLADRAAAGK